MKKFVIFLILIFFLALSLLGIYCAYANIFFSTYLTKTIVVSIFSGILGSVVYMSRGFYQSIAENLDENRKFNFERWVWWYLCRPIMGGITGLLVFIIIYLAFDLQETIKNIFAIFLVSFLSGYNFHQFAENRLSKKIDIF